ncbi:hypothetical protein AM571_PC00308 (plasmid) [Rhizobium etli 8C-3]|uniref:Uncharacterized protein n=1 Tax=Rhizobium etli 8C-3 TaxID=538025 RepID=A0A1L5PCZ2_RHIET|nr:hypothetical protein AM571_PC00308 [Rhizobium etli 8C-3]
MLPWQVRGLTMFSPQRSMAHQTRLLRNVPPVEAFQYQRQSFSAEQRISARVLPEGAQNKIESVLGAWLEQQAFPPRRRK